MKRNDRFVRAIAAASVMLHLRLALYSFTLLLTAYFHHSECKETEYQVKLHYNITVNLFAFQ